MDETIVSSNGDLEWRLKTILFLLFVGKVSEEGLLKKWNLGTLELVL